MEFFGIMIRNFMCNMMRYNFFVNLNPICVTETSFQKRLVSKGNKTRLKLTLGSNFSKIAKFYYSANFPIPPKSQK